MTPEQHASTIQVAQAKTKRRVVFTIVKFPTEAKYNDGRSVMIYRDTEPVSGWLYAGQAHEYRSFLAERYAREQRTRYRSAEIEYTTVERFDDVPDNDAGYREVSRDCMCVTIWE